MRFPLFRRPGAVLFLDDDADYLDMLGAMLPTDWHVELFIRSDACIAQLRSEPPIWEADVMRQYKIIERWREGSFLIPQVLSYWAEDTQRFGLSRACVVDYSMPGLDGIQVLERVQNWPGVRVLLTGRADEQVAVNAFNNGTIDLFIPKQLPNVGERLSESVQRLLDRAHDRHEQIWRNTLTTEQMQLLRDPSVQRDLIQHTGKRWIEHILIGEPFGVLGVDAGGKVSWLHLEPQDRLHELAELAEAEGVNAEGVKKLRAGRSLVDLDLRQSLDVEPAPPRLSPAFSLGREGALLAAFFELPSSVHKCAQASYRNWLKGRGSRQLID